MQRGVFEKGKGLLRDAVFPVVPVEHQPPDSSGGRVFRVGDLGVVAACPVDGENLHRAALGEDGLAVFHSQNVIGAGENGGIQSQLIHGGLPGGREGGTGVQLGAEPGGKFLRQECLRGRPQGCGLSGFRAEAEGIAHPGEDLHTPGGEAFGGRQGGGDGQLQYQVGAAFDGGACPEGFVDDGGMAPLDKIAAHGADNGAIGTEFLPDQGNLLLMAQVQGVVFANNTNGHGRKPPFL